MNLAVIALIIGTVGGLCFNYGDRKVRLARDVSGPSTEKDADEVFGLRMKFLGFGLGFIAIILLNIVAVGAILEMIKP